MAIEDKAALLRAGPLNIRQRSKNLTLLILNNALTSIGTGIGMIAVPWEILQQDDGAYFLGVLAVCVNIFLFFVLPFIGIVIDRVDRRKMMLSTRVISIFAVLILLFVWQFDNAYETIILAAFYFLSSFFYAVNIPNRSALIKDIFTDDEFHKVNSILEIENQVISIGIGGIAVFLLDQVDFTFFLALNLVAYFIAVVFLSFLRVNNQTILNTKTSSIHSFMRESTVGFQHMLRRPAYTMVLITSVVPYVIVILLSYLYPVLLSEHLQVSAANYAIVEVVFAFGAVMSGIALHRMAGKISYAKLTIISMILFLGAVLLQAMFPYLWPTILLAVVMGFGNSAVRVSRFSFLMAHTDFSIIGRVGAVLQSLTMAMRALGFAVITYMVTQSGVVVGLYFAVIIMGISVVLCLLSTQVWKREFQKISN